MGSLKFAKIQANGNDFICFNQKVDLSKSFIKRLCQIHFGIGADGILVLEESKHSDFFMRIYNSDGSEATLCGNGLFCASEYWHLIKGDYPKSIETLSGINDCLMDEDGLWFGIGQGTCIKVDEGFEVNVGNRHLVLFHQDIDDQLLLEKGKYYQDIYAEGINVEIVKLISKYEVKAKVYERGVGQSLSCGSGAVAIFIACKALNPSLRKLHVNYDGGRIMVKEKDNQLYIQSHPKVIYEGEYYDQPRNY